MSLLCSIQRRELMVPSASVEKYVRLHNAAHDDQGSYGLSVPLAGISSQEGEEESVSLEESLFLLACRSWRRGMIWATPPRPIGSSATAAASRIAGGSSTQPRSPSHHEAPQSD